MSSISFESLQSRPLETCEVIGKSQIHEVPYQVCAWKRGQSSNGKAASLYIYLVRDGEPLPGSENFKETTHLKVWTVWEMGAAAHGQSKESVCSLKEEEFFPHSRAIPNVFHVDAKVVARKRQGGKELCLAVKRIAYELFMSSSDTVSEMHLCLTKEGYTQFPKDPDDFEIIRDSGRERSVGWGRPFKMDKVRGHPSILT